MIRRKIDHHRFSVAVKHIFFLSDAKAFQQRDIVTVEHRRKRYGVVASKEQFVMNVALRGEMAQRFGTHGR